MDLQYFKDTIEELVDDVEGVTNEIPEERQSFFEAFYQQSLMNGRTEEEIFKFLKDSTLDFQFDSSEDASAAGVYLADSHERMRTAILSSDSPDCIKRFASNNITFNITE